MDPAFCIFGMRSCTMSSKPVDRKPLSQSGVYRLLLFGFLGLSASICVGIFFSPMLSYVLSVVALLYLGFFAFRWWKFRSLAGCCFCIGFLGRGMLGVLSILLWLQQYPNLNVKDISDAYKIPYIILVLPELSRIHSLTVHLYCQVLYVSSVKIP